MTTLHKSCYTTSILEFISSACSSIISYIFSDTYISVVITVFYNWIIAAWIFHYTTGNTTDIPCTFTVSCIITVDYLSILNPSSYTTASITSYYFSAIITVTYFKRFCLCTFWYTCYTSSPFATVITCILTCTSYSSTICTLNYVITVYSNYTASKSIWRNISSVITTFNCSIIFSYYTTCIVICSSYCNAWIYVFDSSCVISNKTSYIFLTTYRTCDF